MNLNTGTLSKLHIILLKNKVLPYSSKFHWHWKKTHDWPKITLWNNAFYYISPCVSPFFKHFLFFNGENLIYVNHLSIKSESRKQITPFYSRFMNVSVGKITIFFFLCLLIPWFQLAIPRFSPSSSLNLLFYGENPKLRFT